MLKVITVVGTRPELIKLSRVIPALDAAFDHVLVHTGQNYDYELNQIFFDQLQIRKPNHFLGAAGATASETIANVILKVDDLLGKAMPDALLLLGDTNSAMCVIPAKKRKIPIFHMEAGNRCFDQRVPEEVNRKIVDHVSDINLVYTEHARRNLLAEGLPPDRIFRTGSPMPEVLAHHQSAIMASTALKDFGLTKGQYIIISSHREENVDDPTNLENLVESLVAIEAAFKRPILFSVHPRTQLRLNAANVVLPKAVRATKPLGFLDYIWLQQNSFCVVSDSGTLTEESSILGFPSVMIRHAHERPEGMDVGAVVMAGLKPGRVIDAIRLATSIPHAARLQDMQVPDYRGRMLSTQIAVLISSYTDYVNRVVWHRT